MCSVCSSPCRVGNLCPQRKHEIHESENKWDEWADETTGDLGPVYGKQWRNWVRSSRPQATADARQTLLDLGEVTDETNGVTAAGPRVRRNHGVDQIRKVIHEIKTNPDSR